MGIAVCAAPGSKTFQLLEMIHQADKPGELPDGMVWFLPICLILSITSIHDCI